MNSVSLLGAPGSGKGTVAAKLAAENANLKHVSSGDLLRGAVAKGTEAILATPGVSTNMTFSLANANGVAQDVVLQRLQVQRAALLQGWDAVRRRCLWAGELLSWGRRALR